MLTEIDEVDVWFEDERPSYNKMLDVANIINAVASNQILVNTSVEGILHGSGSDQAVMVFMNSSAPMGWTREVSFESGKLLRVTDGSTVPPGSSPTAVGAESGGSWAISGLSAENAGGHDHSISGHSHTIAHAHSSGTHFHTMGSHTHSVSTHSHTVQDQSTINIGMSEVAVFNEDYGNPMGLVPYTHTHTIAAHGHGGATQNGGAGTPYGATTTFVSTNNTGNATTETGSPTVTNTGSATGSTAAQADHDHTISSNSSWRPLYTTSIVCSKD